MLPTAVVTALLLALPTGLAAQAGSAEETTAGGDPAGFGGTFFLDEDAGADMEKVVDRGVSLVKAWYKRPFARGRIEETNRPYGFIQLFPRHDAVVVNTEQWSLEVPREGELDWLRAENDPVNVSIEWRGDHWVQRFEGTDGVRVNRYTLSGDGRTMTVDVTVASDQLREDLEYELVYRRRTEGG